MSNELFFTFWICNSPFLFFYISAIFNNCFTNSFLGLEQIFLGISYCWISPLSNTKTFVPNFKASVISWVIKTIVASGMTFDEFVKIAAKNSKSIVEGILSIIK